jgi:hypothetical protein
MNLSPKDLESKKGEGTSLVFATSLLSLLTGSFNSFSRYLIANQQGSGAVTQRMLQGAAWFALPAIRCAHEKVVDSADFHCIEGIEQRRGPGFKR